MTSRVLPSDEWPKLAGTELGEVVSTLPACATVLVVEDAGEIVGCWSLIPTYHAEGLWIAQAHRGHSSVPRRLWVAMQAQAHEFGLTAVLTNCLSPVIEKLLRHVGASRVPGDTYLVPLKES